MPQTNNHTLVIGPAGSGKSTIAATLKAAGVNCIDADYDGNIARWQNKQTKAIFSGSEDKADGKHDWIWDIGQLKSVLSSARQPLIVCGTANNRSQAYPMFGRIVVLAPTKEIIKQRLQGRVGNDFGKDAGGLSWALQNYDDIVFEAKTNQFEVIDNSHQSPHQTAAQIIK